MDLTGKIKRWHGPGRYYVTTSANKIEYLHKDLIQNLVLLNNSSGGNDRCFILDTSEGCYLVVADTLKIDTVWIGQTSGVSDFRKIE